MTDEFLLKTLRDQPPLRDQVLLIMRQTLPPSFDFSRKANSAVEMKVLDGLLPVLTIVFIESDAVVEDEEADIELRERCEFV